MVATLLLEVLVGVPALRNLIREDKTMQILSVIQTGAQHGMVSLDQSLRDLVMAGKLSREVAMTKSSNPRLFETAAGTGHAAQPEGAATPSAGRVPTSARPAPAPPEAPAKKGLFGL